MFALFVAILAAAALFPLGMATPARDPSLAHPREDLLPSTTTDVLVPASSTTFSWDTRFAQARHTDGSLYAVQHSKRWRRPDFKDEALMVGGYKAMKAQQRWRKQMTERLRKIASGEISLEEEEEEAHSPRGIRPFVHDLKPKTKDMLSAAGERPGPIVTATATTTLTTFVISKRGEDSSTTTTTSSSTTNSSSTTTTSHTTVRLTPTDKPATVEQLMDIENIPYTHLPTDPRTYFWDADTWYRAWEKDNALQLERLEAEHNRSERQQMKWWREHPKIWREQLQKQNSAIDEIVRTGGEAPRRFEVEPAVQQRRKRSEDFPRWRPVWNEHPTTEEEREEAEEIKGWVEEQQH